MAPEETPRTEGNPVDGVSEPRGARARVSTEPKRLTTRERRRRIALLIGLLLLLLALSYSAYYFVQNRRLPSLGMPPVGTDYITPPRYLYSIAGRGPAEMLRPVGVGVAADGRVYVVDFGNRRVSVFTNEGRYLFSFTKTADGDLINPVHLAIKGNEVWVSERRHRTIYIFDLEGKYLRKYEPKAKKFTWTPLALAFDAQGALRVTDVGQTDLHRLVYFSIDGSPTVTVGKTGQVRSVIESPGSFLFPNGLAIAANGDVFVSDGDNRRVQVFDSEGKFVRFIDTSGVPRGIAIDAKQRLYVADALAHSIAVYDLAGRRLTDFGERGFGPGQFNYPNDVTIDRRGRIYVSDRENDQVQVWGWPVAQPPAIAVPTSAFSPWCLLPLLLLPLLLLLRRKIRIVVTPDFIKALEDAEEIRAVSEYRRLRLIAPEEDRAVYEGREVEGVVLTDLLVFEEHSESDAQALMDRYKIARRPAMLVAMAWRAKALGTNDHDLRLIAILAEVYPMDSQEFREVYLKRYHTTGGEA